MRQLADQAEAEGVSEAVGLQPYVQSLGVALQRTNDTADVIAAVRFLAGKGGRNTTGQEIMVVGRDRVRRRSSTARQRRCAFPVTVAAGARS